MDWITRMNMIIDYMEAHLTERIDFKEIEKIACCSNYNFQRVFSFCMETPLAEYIRNRRMSIAAEELRNTETGLLELALKYGYDSYEAFSRAFQRFHGVTPKQARSTSVTLNYCPKATFMYKEDHNMQSQHTADYLLERKPSGELFKNKTPSPITLNFPVSMWTYMEFMGQNTNTMQNYTLISNLSGDTYGAGLKLTTDSGIQTAMEAFGYSCKIYSTRPSDMNYIKESELKNLITEEISINQRPVIAVNVIDCCFGGIISGYKENGNCLLNWGYFPFDFSEVPQPVITECRDWYSKTSKVIFVGEPSSTSIDLKQVYRNCFILAKEYQSNVGKPESFFKEWMTKLMEYDPTIINDYSLIDPMWCDYAEKRFYAGQFMLQMRTFFPEYEHQLLDLWNIYGRTINSLMYEYIAKVNLSPGEECGSIHSLKLKEENVRREMCEIVRKCESEEQRAAEIINEIANKIR